MYPTVIVKSYGSINPDELIKNIIKTSSSSEIIEQFLEIDSKRFKQYLCNIKTKYYQNIISLVPIDDMDDMPTELIKSAEAIIVYFNGDSNLEFQQCIPKLCSIKEANNIELGLFLTDKLSDEKSKGLTYTNLKTMSKTSFDIIELCAEDDDSPSGDGHEYNDVIEALHNNIWSNIQCPPKAIHALSANAETAASPKTESDANVESELESFDELLNKMQQFKALSQNLNRDELLDQAEKLAELFDSLIYGD